MLKRNFIYGLILILSIIALSSCKSGKNLIGSTPTINSKASLEKPYLILISLDGFRWDYIEKYNPPYLSNFIKNGVKAESLIPSYPSKTFPNHYTIATGLYPDRHGIIGNSFYSYKKNLTYKIGNREMVEDGSFYGGTPIWVLADKASMVSASYFFVGSEANIQGIKPTYYYTYDASIKNDVRITQALDWLDLPLKNRPHLITMYFSDMDDIGHRFGPNNEEEIKKTLFNLDENLGDLFKGVDATGLPINIIIVSDHGMTTLSTSNYIPIEDIENDSLYATIDNGAIVNIHPKNNMQTDSIIQYLKQKENNFKVYKTKNTLGFEYNPKNKDWGAIQIIPDFGYYFSKRQSIESRKKNAITTVGVHGYDPKYKDMHGIFYANGSAFKKGYVIPSVKNIHIYPLMCKILGLDIPNNIDGNLNQLESVLKNVE
jgi:predicted AlkP superfamily pyrophosphatase or phosphodiesterase